MQRTLASDATAPPAAAADESAAIGQPTPWRSAVVWLAAALMFEIGAISAVLLLARERLWLFLPLHLLIVAALSLNVRRLCRRGEETTFAMLATLAVAAAGPLGALGTLALAWLAGRRQTATGLLTAWYERIALSIAVDPVARFCDTVSTGRTITLDATPPRSYATVIATGTLVERQNVLGLIARRFHPDYLPILSTALRSPEAVIRVQAAAVAAHVRPTIAQHFREAVADIGVAGRSATAALTLMRTFESLVDSGLLDESDRRQGADIIERLGDVVIARTAKGETALPPSLTIESRVALEAAFERLLLRRRRFAEWRKDRSVRRVLSNQPIARVRRMSVSEHRARPAP
ncbi:MAG: hypothetical protein ACKVP7_03555 [Hyphomicrobiaceae bacterium]